MPETVEITSTLDPSKIKKPNPSVSTIEALLTAAGLESYLDNFKDHRVVDEQLHLMDDENLKEMGVEKVGDRLYFAKVIRIAKRKYVNKTRHTTIWKAFEMRHKAGPIEYCQTCGCFDWISVPCNCLYTLDEYRLTGAALTIKKWGRDIPCYQRVFCCFKGERTTDNIKLSNIQDVDSTIPQAGWVGKLCNKMTNGYVRTCYGETVTVVVDQTDELGAKEYELFVEDATDVSLKIRNAVANSDLQEQLMERT